jgi:plasmid stabilization system protein ParE
MSPARPAWTVVITKPARDDLFAIYDYVADRADEEIALRFIDRIEAFCLGFATVPERGTRRDDLRPGLRTAGFRRRVTILFELDRPSRTVVILGIYYGGRNIGGTTADGDEAP